MRRTQKTRQLYLIALICYLIGLCLLVFPLLDSDLRLLYILGAITEIAGVCVSLLALRAGNRA